MSINLESTTDSKEQVTAALGGTTSEKPEAVEQSVSSESSEETTTDESETSEKLEAKADSEADTDEESEEAETEPKEEAKPKKIGGAQKKINKLVSKLSDREREVEYWKQEALKSAKPRADKEAVETQKPTAEGKPDPNKFDTHEDYVEALADWKVEQKLEARDSKAKEDSLKTDFQRQMKSHVERVNTFAESTPDFHEAIEEIDHIPMSITVQDVILSSEDGPALMYALAKAPEEYARICALPAIAAARELGRFESRLKAETTTQKTKEPKKTKAPAPLKTVNSKGTGGGKKSIYDQHLSQAEYERLRQEQRSR